ncbi:protein inturned-like [Amphibalanus amphitrite]|uniref:protein inturned-like n=1 Tax=Amphibalanus amphitrite TaxID=1232801 RepID=UPI001C91A8F9|nr:protein inturned-like [Amphibalanus amphitrite]
MEFTVSEPPVWASPVDSRGELFYAEVEEAPVYRVVVRLGAGRPAAVQHGPLCESVLGLIGHHQLAPAEPAGAVSVAALAPRGPLVRGGQVHIGDRLERVNGAPVTVDSLQTVLAALPRSGKVRLSFRRATAPADGSPQPPAPLTNGVNKQAASGGDPAAAATTTVSSPSDEGRVTSLTGDGLPLEELGRLLRGVPYGLLCLSTEGLTETSPERQDIVYQFPGYDTALLSARGALLTVAGLTKQISGDTPVRAAVTVGSTPVHVAVTCQEELVLLLAAPEVSLSAPELHQLGTELWQLLRLEFGSLRSALRERSQRPYVDHLLALVFQQALLTPELLAGARGARPQRPAGGLDRLLAAAHTVHLPRHVQVLIEDSLTELESGDFGEESEDFYGLERLYLLRGSALYYKGYLVCSHLPVEDQASVHLVLRHRQLLERTRRGRWRQLVLWRPYRRASAGTTPAPAAEPAPGPAGADTAAGDNYSSEQLDCYLLVVGAKHALLAVLLESGACTVQPAAGAGPDSIYVEEAQATLFQLESMGIMDVCESWLGGNPSLNTSTEEELPGGARPYEGSARDTLLETRWWSRLVAARRTDSRRSRSSAEQSFKGADGPSSLEDTRSGGGGSASGSGTGGRGGSGSGSASWRQEPADSPASASETGAAPARHQPHSASDDGDSSTDDSAADTWEIYRGPPKSRLLPNQYDLMENKKIYMGQALEDSRRVVADSFSVALQHVLLDVPAATYLALPEPLLAAWLRPELVAAFGRAVARLLPLLAQRPPVTGGFSGGPAAGRPHEVGTLFTLDGQEGQTFWVVGRQMAAPAQRLLFVCVPGSTPPNMLEMAFRLIHGTGPR